MYIYYIALYNIYFYIFNITDIIQFCDDLGVRGICFWALRNLNFTGSKLVKLFVTDIL